MNFMRLYIGDYLRDTGTLTVAEHGAYMLMLMHYYATEQPLPTGRALHRLLRAESKADREAIDSIAGRFWQDTDAGLVNARADREIGRADHQRAVNRETGRLGGRPKRTETESVSESETESVSESKPNENRTRTLTRHQTPDTRQERAESTPTPFARAHEDDPENRHADPPTPTAAGLACRAMREAGLSATNPGDPRLLALLEHGATVEELRGVAEDAAARGKGFAWALTALVGRRADAAAIALAPRVNGAEQAHAAIAQSAAYLAEQVAAAEAARTPEAQAARVAAMQRVGRRVAS